MRQSPVDRAIENIRLRTDDGFAAQWAEDLRTVATLANSTELLADLERLTAPEEINDRLVEAMYALAFLRASFQVVLYPNGKGVKGPDLRVTREKLVLPVEVKRIRRPPPDSVETAHLEAVGYYSRTYVPDREIKKAYDAILDKMGQLGYRRGVIAIWNEWLELTHRLAEQAATLVRSEAEQGIRRLPDDGCLVLFGTTSMNINTQRQLFAYPLGTFDKQVARRLNTQLWEAMSQPHLRDG